jgi:hypothetical protein
MEFSLRRAAFFTLIQTRNDRVTSNHDDEAHRFGCGKCRIEEARASVFDLVLSYHLICGSPPRAPAMIKGGLK